MSKTTLSSFGFTVGFTVLIFGYCAGIAACTKAGVTNTNSAVAATIAAPDTVKNAFTYLALGDSYTIGQSVQPNERYPFLTVQELRSENVNIDGPQYIATTGWTTQDLENSIGTQKPSNNYDIVTLLIGVNDQYQHLDTAGYRKRFNDLLNKAVELAKNRYTHVVVLSIPDYSATPFVDSAQKMTVRNEIDVFNAINREITMSKNVSYIDITQLSREVSVDPSLLASDNLHYSAREYQKWAELLVPVIKKALDQ